MGPTLSDLVNRIADAEIFVKFYGATEEFIEEYSKRCQAIGTIIHKKLGISTVAEMRKRGDEELPPEACEEYLSLIVWLAGQSKVFA